MTNDSKELERLINTNPQWMHDVQVVRDADGEHYHISIGTKENENVVWKVPRHSLMERMETLHDLLHMPPGIRQNYGILEAAAKWQALGSDPTIPYVEPADSGFSKESFDDVYELLKEDLGIYTNKTIPNSF